MDGVASGFAVVSLAIQLVETGEKISKFLRSVRDAPDEIVKLCQTLDQLNSTLKQTSHLLEQQYTVLRLPGSPVFIINALRIYEERIRTLDDIVRKVKKRMDYPDRARRTWAAMRFVSKKEDILEIRDQLRDPENGLQTAILNNSWQLQIYHISLPSTTTVVQEVSLAAPNKSKLRLERFPDRLCTFKDMPRITTQETSLVWSYSLFGSIKIQSKLSLMKRPNDCKPEPKAVASEKVVTVTPFLFRRTFELRVSNSLGRIARTLSSYPVLEGRAPIFDICRRGDLQGLQVALSSGGLSPFVLSQSGLSLLHYAAGSGHTEVCVLLLQLGVDSNRRDNLGRQPIVWTGSVPELGRHDRAGKRRVDTLRLLTQNQNETSLQDMNLFWILYDGSAEVAQFMFSQGFDPAEFKLSADEDTYPVLAAALKQYGIHPVEWEKFLRHLLRKGVDLTSPVLRIWRYNASKSGSDPEYPCSILDHGTPLDELFSLTETPFEGKVAADGWMSILSSEGYDVRSYLEEERALHAAQMHLTIPSEIYNLRYDIPRQLRFHWQSEPSVSWDWWIDPGSPASLVCEEFKRLIDPDDTSEWREEWVISWPFRHAEWSDPFVDRDDVGYKRVQERANRRVKKKSMKLARAQGLRKRDRMPGAWPV